jgi:hypothetical protein
MAATQFTVSINMKSVNAAIKRTKRALSKASIAAEMQKIAEDTLKEVIAETPKRWTGNTKRGWQIVKYGSVGYRIRNRYRAMRFLEDGTRAHGPKRARRMFIPLNKRAHAAGPKGVFRNPRAFKMGRDYVLARRVKGIKAHHILKNASVRANAKAVSRFDRLIRKSL